MEAKWAKEMWTKAMDELRATAPNGKVVADTVGIILERENNWVSTLRVVNTRLTDTAADTVEERPLPTV